MDPTSLSSGRLPSDFSIEHILRTAGGRCGGGEGNPAPPRQHATTRFEWLQCTRYHPPKLPRSRRKEGSCSKGRPQQREDGVAGAAAQGRTRKLGRNPRIPFSSGQVSALESRFRHGHYLSSADVASLARTLELSEARVKIWFQNRRARERRDRESSADAGPAATDLPKQGRLASCPRGALEAFPPRTTTTLQGLNSAFVPFPRSRPASLPLLPSTTGGPPTATLHIAAYLENKTEAAPGTV